MKKRLLYAWIGVHLLFIFLVNAVSSYHSYNKFQHRENTSAVASTLSTLLNKKAALYYGRYTGAETGYGFFGINVRSNGILIGECDGKEVTADFVSYETSLRFFSMANALTDDFIKPGTGDTTGIVTPYNNLLLKNIAVTLYQQHQCTDTAVTLSYNLLTYPSLAAVRQGIPAHYGLIRLITASYSLQPYAHQQP